MTDLELLEGEFTNIRGYSFKVIARCDYKNSNGQALFKVKFSLTNYETAATKQLILNGSVRDRFAKECVGVGYYGNASSTGKNKTASIRWAHMLARCYDKSSKDYSSYGGKGVTVTESWHCFANFLRDLPELPGYNEEDFQTGKLSLDKDILQQGVPTAKKVYSKETCVLVTLAENIKYRNTLDYKRKFLAIDPEGHEYIGIGVVAFAREHNLDPTGITRCINLKTLQHKGWHFKATDNVIE